MTAPHDETKPVITEETHVGMPRETTPIISNAVPTGPTKNEMQLAWTASCLFGIVGCLCVVCIDHRRKMHASAVSGLGAGILVCAVVGFAAGLLSTVSNAVGVGVGVILIICGAVLMK